MRLVMESLKIPKSTIDAVLPQAVNILPISTTDPSDSLTQDDANEEIQNEDHANKLDDAERFLNDGEQNDDDQ